MAFFFFSPSRLKSFSFSFRRNLAWSPSNFADICMHLPQSEFFTSSDVQSGLIFSQPAGQKDYSYTDVDSSVASSLLPDSFYDQNDTLAAVAEDSQGNLVSSGRGYFSLPQADVSGLCNDNAYVAFENNVEGSCRRVVPASLPVFASQCVHQQSMARYVSDLFVAVEADVLASSGAVSSTQVVGVSLASVEHVDWLSGESTDVTSSWTTLNCSTQSYPTTTEDLQAMNASSCVFASPTTRTQLLTAQAVCTNWIKQVSYRVLHQADAQAAIINITAEVVVTDVPISLASLQLSQSFAVDFSSVLTAGASSSNGNLVARQRSGNPGYLLGMPVLFGSLATTVVNERIEGLTLPQSAVSCPTSLSGRSLTTSSFGYDTLSGCSVRFTRQELKDFCCKGASGSCLDNADDSFLQDSPYVSSTGVPYFLNFTTGVIGMYGDADPLDVSQWFAMESIAVDDRRAWNDRTGTCSNVFSGTRPSTRGK